MWDRTNIYIIQNPLPISNLSAFGYTNGRANLCRFLIRIQIDLVSSYKGRPLSGEHVEGCHSEERAPSIVEASTKKGVRNNLNKENGMKKVYGIGVNDADYPVTSKIGGKRVLCPFYRVWTHMLERCYSPQWQKKKPTYIGCKVTPEWLLFMSFKSWMETQDWKGKSLDKDVMYPGNKLYGADGIIALVECEVNYE